MDANAVTLSLYVAGLAGVLVVQSRTRLEDPAGDAEMAEAAGVTGQKPVKTVTDTAALTKGFRHLAGLGLVLAYAWVCDRSGSALGLSQTSKRFDGGIAVLAVLAVAVPYAASFEPQGKSAGFLGNGQTDEWKGWMQIFLVFYHYLFPSPQPLAVYVTARIVVASFLFMTGYGRTMSAMKRAADFSFYTLCSMMLRLNLFVILLAAVMGRQFCDYYFSPLVTFWSLFYYALHTLGRAWSPAQRIAFAAVVCAMLSINAARTPGRLSVARLLFEPVSFLVSSPVTSLDTWLFRCQLDCFSPLMGAIVALNTDRINTLLTTIEGAPPAKQRLMTSALAAGGLVAMGAWVRLVASVEAGAQVLGQSCAVDQQCSQWKKCATSADPAGCVAARAAQEEYNYSYHSVLCVVPVLAFVLARNLTPWLRARASTVVAFWGQRSLEIYLLQYHVWLSSNAARILVVLPGRPVMNACVVFAGFLAAADVAHRCTSGMAGVLLAQKFQLPGPPRLWAAGAGLAYAGLCARMLLARDVVL